METVSGFFIFQTVFFMIEDFQQTKYAVDSFSSSDSADENKKADQKQTKEDNEVYSKLQEQYLKNRDPETLTKMYYLVKRYLFRYFMKYQRRRNLYFREDEISDLVEDMTMFTISQYLKRPEFKVEKMSAYAYFGFIKIMFEPGKMKIEQLFKKLNSFPEEERLRLSEEFGITVIHSKNESKE